MTKNKPEHLNLDNRQWPFHKRNDIMIEPDNIILCPLPAKILT